PTGPTMFCVATDPDVMLPDLMAPTTPGLPPGTFLSPKGPPGGLKGGPGGPKMGPDGLPPGLPGAPGEGPDGKEAPPPPKGAFNPMVKDFSEEEKEKLRTIHKKYGTFGQSPA